MIPTSRRNPCTADPQYLERDLWMGQAQCMEVLLAHEAQRGIVEDRRRIGSAVEDRQLSYRASRFVDAEHMFPPAGGTFKNTDVSGFDNVQAQTGFAFAENHLALCIPVRQSMLCEQAPLAVSQSGEDRDLCERRTVIDFRLRHDGYCTGHGRSD